MTLKVKRSGKVPNEKIPKKKPKKKPLFSAVDVAKIIEECSVEYGKYVNEQRHIPDYRDGLKPVQRRVLWTMFEDGIRWDARFTKCAAVVGNALSRYHPHGDKACYDALVVMAGAPTEEDKNIYFGAKWQYPLIEGYGNFGSIDGDKPAAMRYPECRLSKLSQFLFNLRSCVETIPNYLNNRPDPLFLPAVFPFLLINGVTGIGFGVTSDIPPHNFGEVCDALIVSLKEGEVPPVLKLMDILKGPDYAYGGILWDDEEVENVYRTGTGTIAWGLNTKVEEKGKDKYLVKIFGIPPHFKLNPYLLKLNEDKEVKKIRKLETSEHIEVDILCSSKKAMEKIVYHRHISKNDWNVTVRRSEEEIDFKHVTLRSYLEMWIKYCVATHKKYFKNEITRLNGEIRADVLRLLAFKNIDDVIPLIREEKDKALMKLLGCTEDELVMVKRIVLGALAKTNEEAIKKRMKEKQAEASKLKGYIKNTEKYLIAFFTEIKKYSRERTTQILS